MKTKKRLISMPIAVIWLVELIAVSAFAYECLNCYGIQEFTCAPLGPYVGECDGELVPAVLLETGTYTVAGPAAIIGLECKDFYEDRCNYVIRYMCNGSNRIEFNGYLVIQESIEGTVRAHQANLYRKLRVHRQHDLTKALFGIQ